MVLTNGALDMVVSLMGSFLVDLFFSTLILILFCMSTISLRTWEILSGLLSYLSFIVFKAVAGDVSSGM